MTTNKKRGILKVDTDRKIAYHYNKNGIWHRRILAEINEDGHILHKDPGTKELIDIGWAVEDKEAHVIILVLRII